MEDDAVFGKHTCEIIDDFLINNRDFEWDILFTDICVLQIQMMVELIRLRHKITSANKVIRLLKLDDIPFAGSTAYILNAKSKRKIYNLLNAEEVLCIG